MQAKETDKNNPLAQVISSGPVISPNLKSECASVSHGLFFHWLLSWQSVKKRKRARHLPFTPENSQGRGTVRRFSTVVIP